MNSQIRVSQEKDLFQVDRRHAQRADLRDRRLCNRPNVRLRIYGVLAAAGVQSFVAAVVYILN